MMWPNVVEIRAFKMIDGHVAEARVPVTMELLTDAAGSLAHYLTREIDAAFDRLAQ